MADRRERELVYMDGLPVIAQRANLETKTFWDATALGKLMLKRCDRCGTVIWYPRELCSSCGSLETSWFEASGKGTVYSCTVTHKGQGAFRDSGPFVLAYVELEEGPRLMTNIVGAEPSSIHIGQAVEVVFHDTGQGSAIPRFRPI